MRQKRTWAAVSAACAIALVSTGAAVLSSEWGSAAASAPSCDKSCLLNITTAYTESITTNKLAGLPVTATVRDTSNGTVTPLGKGEVWGANRRIQYRQTFVDPTTESVMFLGTVTDGGSGTSAKWWFYVARLTVVGQKVSEVEEISSDIDFRAFDSQATLASQMVLPDRAWSEVLPADEQTTRAGLIQSANNYWDWLGSDKDATQVPFGPDCQRTENGTFTTNSHVPTTSCPAFFSSPIGALGVGYMTVVNRRIIFADTDRGVVGGIANFAVKLNGKVIGVGVTPEIFKVQAGHIQLIEAFFRPDGQAQAGWGEDPPAASAAVIKEESKVLRAAG